MIRSSEAHRRLQSPCSPVKTRLHPCGSLNSFARGCARFFISSQTLKSKQHMGALQGKDWIPPVERKAEHGLESDASLRARLMSIFDNDILASGSSVLIVSHGAAISVLLNTLIARGFVSQDQVPTGRSVANCSVSVIEAVNKDQGAISSIGDEGYLQTRSDVVVGDA